MPSDTAHVDELVEVVEGTDGTAPAPRPRVTVLSMNTAIDRVLRIPRLVPGTVMRTDGALAFAGGKGLNVARNLRLLHEDVQVVGFLGGAVRDFIQSWCNELEIHTIWAPTAGQSRTCTILIDNETGTQTVVNEPGPTVSPAEVDGLMAALHGAVQPGDLLCISGSAPPGVPDDLYGRIVREMNDREVRVLVDATAGPLRSALEAIPWAVCPNEQELRVTMIENRDTLEPTRELGENIPVVIVTLGREGCLLASEGHVWRLHPPIIDEVNAVGSGDAFAAGFLAGTLEGEPPIDAVTLGVACGASNAGRLEPGIGSRDEVEGLRGKIRIEELSP
jgi:1-phosphofructokinase family hexose kinase